MILCSIVTQEFTARTAPQTDRDHVADVGNMIRDAKEAAKQRRSQNVDSPGTTGVLRWGTVSMVAEPGR